MKTEAQIRKAKKCNKKCKKLYKGRKKLLNFIMIILKWYLRLTTNQFMVRTQNINSKNKCFKDYQ